jgi:hypothetical protein
MHSTSVRCTWQKHPYRDASATIARLHRTHIERTPRLRCPRRPRRSSADSLYILARFTNLQFDDSGSFAAIKLFFVFTFIDISSPGQGILALYPTTSSKCNGKTTARSFCECKRVKSSENASNCQHRR